MLINKKIYNSLALLVIISIVYLVIFQLSTANSSKIDITFFRESLTILQGGSNTTKIKVKNIHNETLVFVTPKFDKPSGIEVSTSPELYTDLGINSLAIFNFDVSVDQDLENGTYTIKVWVESESATSGESVNSEKYSFNVTVSFNPGLVNATTTTTSIPTTSTTETTITGVTTTEVDETEETIPQMEEKIKEMTSKKEYLIIFAVILIALILVPYFTFKKSKS